MNSDIRPDKTPITDPRHIPATPVYSPTPGQTTFLGVAHIGPIPPAHELARYGEVQKDLPGRIMAMAEQNAATERRLKERNQTFQLVDSLARRIIALIAFIASLGFSYALIMAGHSIIGSMFCGGAIVSVVLAIIRKDGEGKEKPAPQKR